MEQLSFGSSNEIIRYVKHKHPKSYQQASAGYIQEKRVLTQDDVLFDFMLNAVRLKRPILLDGFIDISGISPSILLDKLKYAFQMKWVKNHDGGLYLTDKGYLLSDEIVKLML